MNLFPIQRENQEENSIEVFGNSAKKYIEASKSKNTKRAYRADWKHFMNWCSERELDSLPAMPETVALYISHLADLGYKTSTIQRRLTTISQAHQTAGYESPTRTTKVRSVFQGIKRTLGVSPEQKKAVSIDILKAILEPLGDSLIDIRNCALLLIGWSGGLRRSEISNLDISDIEFTDEGMKVRIRKSKTDQEGRGRLIGIPFGQNAETCPVRALQKWIQRAGIKEGSLFRPINRHGQIQNQRLTGDGIAYLIKQVAKKAGFNPEDFAGHSLRRGFITTAAKKGKSEASIMRQTGHRSIQTMRRYIEEANIFENNAAKDLGL